jgi:hypothetical protein
MTCFVRRTEETGQLAVVCLQVGGEETLDSVFREGEVGGFDGSGEGDGAAGVFEDLAGESEGGAVDGGEADAEVVGEASEEEAGEAAVAEVAGEAGWGAVVVFEEGGVGVDAAADAFAQDEFGVGEIEGRVERGSVAVLEAVVGPEGLVSVGDGDALEGLPAGVGGGEGDVAGGMPVLGEEDVVKSAAEGVNEWHDGVAVVDGEGAAGAEVVLDVDDEESVGAVVD